MQEHSLPAPTAETLDLSIISPAHREQDNLAGLVADIREALASTGYSYEILIVDDGSDDQTFETGTSLMADPVNRLRMLRLDTPPGQPLGPSAGYALGIRMARGRVIATMDADRQNDPRDIPAMMEFMRSSGAALVQGDRSRNRRDNAIRRFSSWVGRRFRQMVLGDTIRDSACAMRLLDAGVARAIPFELKGMQRFTAFYTRMIGCTVVEIPVNHRPRIAGQAKFGIWNRALPGLIDLLAMCWMKSRWRIIHPKSKPDAQPALHESQPR